MTPTLTPNDLKLIALLLDAQIEELGAILKPSGADRRVLKEFKRIRGKVG